MGSGWDTIEAHAGFKVKGAVKALPSYVNEAKHILLNIFYPAFSISKPNVR